MEIVLAAYIEHGSFVQVLPPPAYIEATEWNFTQPGQWYHDIKARTIECVPPSLPVWLRTTSLLWVFRIRRSSAATRTGALLNPCFLLLQVPSRAW